MMCISKTGHCYNAEDYTGKKQEKESYLGLGGVVMKNISQIQHSVHHKIYFDNYFTSFGLVKTLHDKGISATGICRLDKMPI